MTALERAIEMVRGMVGSEKALSIYYGRTGLDHETIQDYILLCELAKDPIVIERAAAIHAELLSGARDPEVEL